MLFASCATAATKPLNLSLNGLSSAVQQIEKLSGVCVIYEGIRDEYPGDYEEVTEKTVNPDYEKIYGHKPPRILGPRAVQLFATISVDAATGYLNDLQSVRDALLAVISAYNSGGPGAFDLESYNDFFFVKPTRNRDEKGEKVPIQPLLSTPITLPSARRTFQDTMYLIFDQITRATGFRIRLGGNPSDMLLAEQTTIGASNEPACVVILRLLQSVDTAEGKKDPAIYPLSSYAVGYTPMILRGFVPKPGWYALVIDLAQVSKPGAPDPRFLPPPKPTPSPAPPDGRGGALRRR